MKVIDTSKNTRNNHICVGILAHVDAGKTTLSEGLLYTAGQIRKVGRVDHGDAYLDTYELEKERGITIFSKQAVLTWHHTQMTLLDTPGHVDFSAEMERTLPILDYAILVISGADGVQGHTRTLWKLLHEYEIPTFLFINKMDQPGADREALLAEMREQLDGGVTDFTGEHSESFYESIALSDETILEQFLETGRIDEEAIPELIKERKIFPCYFGSALKMQGVAEFMQGISDYTEAPVYGDEFGAKVFKIARDTQGNRLTYVKVTGGVLTARMELAGAGGEWREKVNQIRIYSGSKYETISEARAGMVCALTGLTKTYPGEGLGIEEKSKPPVLEPVLTYRIQLPEGVDAAGMLSKLRMLEEEEPELHIVWNEELQEIQAQVMGEVQIDILKHLIEERFGVCVSFDAGNIVYKETIQTAAEGVGHFEPLRHYAEVHLWLEPGEPGSGFQAAVDCSEDMLDKNWQRLIVTHLTEREHRGVLTGAPLTDVKVTLIAGRAHVKHTEGGDFRQATYRAVRQGLMQAEPELLEPYYEFRLEIPEHATGRAMTDMERLGAEFSLQQGSRGISVLTGQAPVVTMRDYAAEVTAYTRGEGRLFCSPCGYRPCHEAETVIKAADYNPEQDTENPCGSVFCAHGAGFQVPWDEVKNYMHIQTGYGKKYEEETEKIQDIDEQRTAGREDWIDVEEVDAILARASYANRKGEPVSHKGISAKKVRSVQAKPTGLSKPGKKRDKQDCYLLVDGYNIIFAWDELRELSKVHIDAARGRLMDILCNYQGYRGCHLILVFDAYRIENHRTEVLPYHNITVVFTKEAETADQYIEKFAHENAKKHFVTVATSDGLEQIIIRGEGCRLMSARELLAEVKRAEEELREKCIQTNANEL